MSKPFVPFVLAIALGALMPAQETWPQDGPSLGELLVDQAAEAYRRIEEARKNCDASSREIQTARGNYQAALRSGQGVDAARAELYRLLDDKDFLYMGIFVVSGMNSPQTKFALETCDVDGGIRTRVSPAFFDLVREIRLELGVMGPDDPVLLLNPLKFIDALEAQRARANAYLRARNLHEIYASGVPMEQLFSAEAYLKILLEMDYSLSTLSILEPDMDTLPQRHLDLAVKVFGKKLVMEAAETVLKLPKDEAGFLLEFFTADRVRGTHKPFEAFNAILKTEPKGFVIFTRKGRKTDSWPFNINEGLKYYDDLVSRHGRDRVHDVVESLRTAPRLFGGKITVPDGAGYKTESDIWFLEKLLTDPTFDIAGDKDFEYLAAGDTEAISKSKDKIQVVYGRVNDVRWADGGRKNNLELGGYFHVYFAGVTKFGVRIYAHDFDRSRRIYGDDAQGLTGKLIRVQGTVWQSRGRNDDSIRPDWEIRASDGNFWTVADEEWPDYLPIPDMEPARSLDELRAAVTHVDVEPASEPPEDRSVAVRASAEASMVSPLRCRDSGPERKGDISKLSPSVGMGHYFYQIAPYAKPVAHYEAYSEVCSGVANSVRDDFLLAAFGDLEDEYSVQLDTHVENEYQAYCVIKFDKQCNQVGLEYVRSKYQEVMAVLDSGDLQRERDRLIAHEKSTSTSAVKSESRSRANAPMPAAAARPKLPANWKKHAKVVGKYEALSKVCSGAAKPAIRDDFLSALDGATDDQATELTAMIDSSYETQLDARQRVGKPCNDQMLQRLQRQYRGALTAVAGG